MHRRIGLKRTATAIVGGLLLVNLFTAGPIFGKRVGFTTVTRAQETAQLNTTSQRQFHCSNESLTGRYAVIGDGFVRFGEPPAPSFPFATVSLMIMDGAGNLSNHVTRSINGSISRSDDLGSYTVNADCTGTMTIVTPQSTLTFDLVVADLQGAAQAKEFYMIATTPGGTVTATAKRIQ